jgi:hypothetical protein
LAKNYLSFLHETGNTLSQSWNFIQFSSTSFRIFSVAFQAKREWQYIAAMAAGFQSALYGIALMPEPGARETDWERIICFFISTTSLL